MYGPSYYLRRNVGTRMFVSKGRMEKIGSDFIICALPEILLKWANLGIMSRHAACIGMLYMYIRFSFDQLKKKRNHFEKLEIDGTRMFRLMLKTGQ
jgi:hypothetical protein